MEKLLFYLIFNIHILGFLWSLIFFIGDSISDNKWWFDKNDWKKEIPFIRKYVGYPIVFRIILWLAYFSFAPITFIGIIFAVALFSDIIYFILFIYNVYKEISDLEKR